MANRGVSYFTNVTNRTLSTATPLSLKWLSPGTGLRQVHHRGLRKISTKFLSYDQIVNYLESVREGTLLELGTTAEKRRVLGLRLGRGPACVLEAGAHAREWASPVAALHVLRRLLQEPQPGLTWIIVPLLNPDGYEYSRNHKLEVGGCSKDPCSEIYCGKAAWSEPESSAIRDLLKAEKEVLVYLSVHSCLQAIMYPPAYSIKPPSDLPHLEEVAIQVQERILNECGSLYLVGQSSIIDRMASGSSIDWARDAAGVKYAYNIELRGPDAGFNLPESQVDQAGRELYVIVKMLSIRARQSKNIISEK